MSKLAVSMAGEIAISKAPGKSMRKWREIFNVTQTELADYLKISPSTISDYEGGRRSSPGIAVIKRFVESLIELDLKRNGKIVDHLQNELKSEKSIFDVHSFYKEISGNEFVKRIYGKCLACEGRLDDTKLYGYTVIDSLRAILEVPVHDYLKMFGETPNRALVFCKVSTGRSPMIAVKIGKFSTDMKPGMIVLHGVESADPLAIKIAESERIPLVVSKVPIEDLIGSLKQFES